LPPLSGFALVLGPGFPTAVGLALGLSRSVLGAGWRGRGWWVPGRRCSHARTPQKREGEGSGGHGPRRWAGGAAGRRSRLQTGTTRPGRSARVGVTSDGAENAPRLRVTYGEDAQASVPPLESRVEAHTARAQGSSTPVPWRWRSRGARIRSCKE